MFGTRVVQKLPQEKHLYSQSQEGSPSKILNAQGMMVVAYSELSVVA
jgi:hypothetical protein